MKYLLFSFLLLFSTQTLALSGSPKDFFYGWETKTFGSWTWERGLVNQQPYIPGDGNWEYPVVFIRETNPQGKLILKVRSPGHNAVPSGENSNCNNINDSKPGFFIIKPCAGHYPSHEAHRTSWGNGTIQPMGWWGWFLEPPGAKAPSNTYRIALSLTRAAFQGDVPLDQIDFNAGWHWEGTSYAGTGGILQSMLMRQADPFWFKTLTVVESNLPSLLFVEDIVPNNPFVQAAWGKDYLSEEEYKTRLNKANFRLQARFGLLDHIYYKIVASAKDTSVNSNFKFFDYCDEYKLACFGLFHNGGHALPETGINLPFNDLYPGEDMEVRFDKMLVVFTNSSANRVWCGVDNNGKKQPCERGHYNLGWSIYTKDFFIDNEEGILVPIRYKRTTNIGGDVPDQPLVATADVTIRRVKNFKLEVGEKYDWEIIGKDQSGTVTVTKFGEITIPEITMQSEDNYYGLIINKYKENEEIVQDGYIVTSTPIDKRPFKDGIQDRAIGQIPSDVGFVTGQNTSQSDVKIKWDDGTWETVFNCTSDSGVICSAQEADISPDKTKVAYSVTYAQNEFEHTGYGAKLMSGIIRSEIRIRDLISGEDYAIPNQLQNRLYRMPRFITNEKLVIVSNESSMNTAKDRHHCHRGFWPNGQQRWDLHQYCTGQEYTNFSMQLWLTNIDGTGKKNITPEQDQVIRPTVLKHPKHNGRIVASCLQNRNDKSYDKSSKNGGTRKNHWWLCSWNNDGTDMTVVFGAHKSLKIIKKVLLDAGVTGGQVEDELLAIRAVGEDDEGNIYVTFYYRQNHYGLGIVVKFSLDNHAIEGVYLAKNYENGNYTSSWPGSGRHTPVDLETVTPFGSPQDMDTMRDAEGRPMGKAGFAFNLGDGTMGITVGEGNCYLAATAETLQEPWLGGEPTCNRNIYRILQEPVTDPFDRDQLEPILVSDDEHFWEAIRITKTAEAPIPEPLEGNECHFGVINAKDAELSPKEPYRPTHTFAFHCGIQGCAVKPDDPNFISENLKSLAFYGVTRPIGGVNSPSFRNQINKVGVNLHLLGRCPIQEDGSALCQVPCETEIMMKGHDEAGRAIASDPVGHSLRKGETRVCTGCHVHSEESKERYPEPREIMFSRTIASGLNPPLLNGNLRVTWEDVKPIIENRCGSCHLEMNDNDGLLYDKIVWDREQVDFEFLSKLPTRVPGDFTLPYPHTSGLLAHFWSESRLGWYVEDQRLDGRTNEDYPDDANFVGPHNSGVTEEEKMILREWVNQGVPLQ